MKGLPLTELGEMSTSEEGFLWFREGTYDPATLRQDLRQALPVDDGGGEPDSAEVATFRDAVTTAHVRAIEGVEALLTAEQREMVRAREARQHDASGREQEQAERDGHWDVTAEVTPHHLLLTTDLLVGYDPTYKVNPPLRPQEDVEALRAALVDGTIDIVATDHAPHARHDKEHAFVDAAFGMLGLETALGIVLTRVVGEGEPVNILHHSLQVEGYLTESDRGLWGGVIILLFVVFHVLHLTTRDVDPAGWATRLDHAGRYDIYGNVVASFQIWWVTAIYLVAMVLLGLHLWHGVWSSGRSLGVARPSAHPLRRRMAPILALALWLGFSIVPLAVAAGVIR